MINRAKLPFTGLQLISLAAGVASLALAAAGIFISGPDQFFQAYLYAYLYWLGLGVGSLSLAMLHYLVGGRWGVIIRRILEAGAKTLWVLALLFIPLLFGLRSLYPWAQPDVVAANPVLQHKGILMNVPFFIFRAALYFAVWIFFTWRLTRMVTQPRYWLDMEDRRVFQRLSAIGLIVYVLLMTFAAVDWIMSLQPDWYSTIYGLIIIIAQALVTFSFSLAILPWLARKKPLSEVVNAGLYRDLGALLFTSVMGWAYLAFMQLLIIWSGNLPHEAVWYVVRSQGGWLWIGLFAFIFQFALPFVVLLSLRAKRNPLLLAALGIAIVVTNLVYYYWQVAPVFHPEGFTVHWLDFVTPIGIGGIWMAAFLWYLERTPVLLPHGESLELLKSEEEHPAVAE